jgi:predicted dehydrogenase
VELVAACDRSAAARRFAREAGLRTYTEPEYLLGHEELDAVSICTPPIFHAPVAIACLERGLDVLCEKPLATNAHAALEMLRVATREGRHLLLATKFRHVPDLIAARALIQDGAIGEPIAFEVDFSSMVDMSRRWNCRRAVAGGGVIIDNGCHALDIVTYLFGTVARVQATRLKTVQNIGVEDSATIVVGAGRGLVGRIDVSWSLATGRETYVTVYGSKGTIEVGWRRSRLRIAGRDPEPIGPGYDKNDAHVRMLEAFKGVCGGYVAPWITPVEAMRTVASVEACYVSMRSGSWVQVDMMGMREAAGRMRKQA